MDTIKNLAKKGEKKSFEFVEIYILDGTIVQIPADRTKVEDYSVDYADGTWAKRLCLYREGKTEPCAVFDMGKIFGYYSTSGEKFEVGINRLRS